MDAPSNDVKLRLVDHDPAVVAAWRVHFAPFPEVTIAEGDLLAVARRAVVSPANGYGFMDGGIDRAYAAFFGPRLEASVVDMTRLRPEGHLPVGAAELVPTGHARIPYLIVAPTVLLPEHVPALNAQRALRAVLRVASRSPHLVPEVYCPGLATGVGAVSPDEAARHMAAAYAAWRIPR